MGMAWEPFFISAYTVAVGTAMAVSSVLAVLLLRRKESKANLLAATVAGFAVGTGGLGVAAWLPEGTAPLAGLMFATVPMTAAAFLHFCTLWAAQDLGRRGRIGLYGLAGVTMLTAMVLEVMPGFVYLDLEGVPTVAPVPQGKGWGVVAVTVVLLGVAYGVLFRGLQRRKDRQGLFRRESMAIAGAGVVGLMAVSGLPGFPGGRWASVLLPVCPVVLVYGVLRYRAMEINLWARRSLLAGLVVLAAVVPAGVAAALVSEGGGGIVSVVLVATLLAAVVAALVVRPAGHLATRIIYPGGALGPGKVEAWERRLEEASDHASLADLATTILSAHLGHPVTLLLMPGRKDDPGVGKNTLPFSLPQEMPTPAVVCEHGPGGRRARLLGWEDAPPGPRLAVQVMAGLVTAAAVRLDRTLTAMERARAEMRTCCMEEFGSLAASAQDLRATVDTIAMTTLISQGLRTELAGCCRRLDSLLNELLLDPAVLPPPETNGESDGSSPGVPVVSALEFHQSHRNP
ncbi:MAG: integral membrane sensor signal transduction histidine kinase [Rhodospirillaceae bacterium]|nr:MAG: integral membrane sensor signal transduction histidine kinase [Rhodospirillaceae bacterium]